MNTDINSQTGVREITKEPETTRDKVKASTSTSVALVISEDRYRGVLQAVESLEQFSFKDHHVLLKPNFNSSDPPPGSTHKDVLKATIELIRRSGAEKITVADRSGMGSTREVMNQLDVFRLADELEYEVVVFDELPADEWEYVQPSGSHWKKGFAIPKLLQRVDSIVQTCCLKTHRFGGHFTLSLKNSVGIAAKKVPGDKHDYMMELHTSRHQRKMIAEINTTYSPDLIVLDGVTAFTKGGPANGNLVTPNVILAGTDRIAIDAIGVAILRLFGTTRNVSKGKVFEQAQIVRAIELGLGINSPEQINFVTSDQAGESFVSKIKEILHE